MRICCLEMHQSIAGSSIYTELIVELTEWFSSLFTSCSSLAQLARLGSILLRHHINMEARIA